MRSCDYAKILEDRNDRLVADLTKKRETSGMTTEEVFATDPFFAGQCYLMMMVNLDVLSHPQFKL